MAENFHYWTSYLRSPSSGRLTARTWPVRLLRSDENFAVIIPLAGTSRFKGRTMSVTAGEVTTYFPLSAKAAQGTQAFFAAEKKRQLEDVPELAEIRRLRRLADRWGPYGIQPSSEQMRGAIRRTLLVADRLAPFTANDRAWIFFDRSLLEAARYLNPEYGRPSPTDVAQAGRELRHMLDAVMAAASRFKTPTFEGLSPKARERASDLWREARAGVPEAAEVLIDVLLEDGMPETQVQALLSMGFFKKPDLKESAFFRTRRRRKG